MRRRAADAGARATFSLFKAREMRRQAQEQREGAQAMRSRLRRREHDHVR